MGRLAASVVTFFFIYSVQLEVSPGHLGTRVWIGLAGIPLLAVWLLRRRGRLSLDRHVILSFVTLLAVGVFSLVTTALNSSGDFAFATYVASVLVIGSGATFVAWLVQRTYGSKAPLAASLLLINVVGAQVALALLAFLIPDLSTILVGLQVNSDLDQAILSETGEFRLIGFGSRFFGSGITNSFALIVIANILRDHLFTAAKRYALSGLFVLISVGGMMMSRSTLIGLAIALIYIAMPIRGDVARALRTQRRAFLMAAILTPTILSLILVLVSSEMLEGLEPALRFGFELFVNYFDGNELSSQSTTHLLDMYNSVGDLPLLTGDGYYSDPFDSALYYGAVDIGYFRLILYFGLPGLLAYLSFQVQSIRLCARHIGGREGTLFTAAVITLLLALNLKGFTDLIVFSAFLYACSRPASHAWRDRRLQLDGRVLPISFREP